MGIQNGNVKSYVDNNLSLKKCLSIILKLVMGYEPTENVNDEPIVFNLKKLGPKWYLTVLYSASSEGSIFFKASSSS